MPIVLLIAAAIAQAAPVVVVLPATDSPTEAKLDQHLRATLARPDLNARRDGLPDPAALAQALLDAPTECWPGLTEELVADLYTLRETADELYVALPQSAKTRDTLLWRFEAEGGRLYKVASKAASLQVPPENAVVALLPFGKTDGRLKARDLARIGAGAEFRPTQPNPSDLVDQLLEHPNECAAEVDDAAREAISALADDVDGELILAVRVPSERSAFLWRWDADERQLMKRH